MSGLNFACLLTSNVGGLKSHGLGDRFLHRLRIVLGLARERSPYIFSHVASAVVQKLPNDIYMVHVRHNFAQRFNLKYNECHVHCKLKDSKPSRARITFSVSD